LCPLRASSPPSPNGARTMVRCSSRRDPDGVLPHRGMVRLRARRRGPRPHHHGQGHRRWDAPRSGDRARRDHELGHEGGLGGTYGGTRWPQRPPSDRSPPCGSWTSLIGRHLGEIILVASTSWPANSPVRRRARSRRDVRARAGGAGTTDPDPVATKRVAALCHHRASSSSPAAPTATWSGCCHHWSSATTCSTRASVCWRVRCARCSAPDSGSAGETRFG